MHRCLKCGMAWAADTGAEDRFVYITKFCPLCMERFPRLPHLEPLGAARRKMLARQGH